MQDVQSCATHRKQQLEKLKEVFSKLDMDPDGDIRCMDVTDGIYI